MYEIFYRVRAKIDNSAWDDKRYVWTRLNMPRGRTEADSVFGSPQQCETAFKEWQRGQGYDQRHDLEWQMEARPIDWKRRENLQFIMGTYKRPVWSAEAFWQNHINVWADHFPHIGVKDPTMLAFTPSPEDGERDRQAIMKPGKYLHKFFGPSSKDGTKIGFGHLKGKPPVLDAKQIAYYAEWWARGEKPGPCDGLDLKWATTPEEVARVYIHGPRSCMGGASNGYQSSYPSWMRNEKWHATRAYSSPDLQVVYMEDPTHKPCKIIARALVWPEKKVFGRVYPTQDNYAHDGWKSSDEAVAVQNALRAKLKKLGYTDMAERRSVFDGARVTRIQCTDDPDIPGDIRRGRFFLLPYLDGHYVVTEAKGEDQDKFFLMRPTDRVPSGTKYYTGSTSGLIQVLTYFTCDYCRSTKQDVDSRGRALYREVATDWAPPPQGQPLSEGAIGVQKWCTDCASYEAWVCRGTGVHFQTRNAKVKQVVDGMSGNTYCDKYTKHVGAYICKFDGQMYMPNETPSVEVGGKVYARHNLNRVAFYCRHDQKWYPMDAMSTRFSGFPAKYDDDASITELQRLQASFDYPQPLWLGERWTIINQHFAKQEFQRRSMRYTDNFRVTEGTDLVDSGLLTVEFGEVPKPKRVRKKAEQPEIATLQTNGPSPHLSETLQYVAPTLPTAGEARARLRRATVSSRILAAE